MGNRFRRLPSPAMAVAFVALLAALGGTAVALPGKNSVKKDDIAAGAVNSSDIKNSSVLGKDVRNNTLTGLDVNEARLGKVPSAARADTAGSAGSANTANSAGRASSAGRADSASSADAAGDTTGASGPLAAGKTLRGIVAAADDVTAAGQIAMGKADFQIPLTAAPIPHIIAPAAPAPAGCSGTAANPGANSGHLCIFMTYVPPNGGPLTLIDNTFTARRFGFAIYNNSTGAGRNEFYGNWAVTG